MERSEIKESNSDVSCHSLTNVLSWEKIEKRFPVSEHSVTHECFESDSKVKTESSLTYWEHDAGSFLSEESPILAVNSETIDLETIIDEKTSHEKEIPNEKRVESLSSTFQRSLEDSVDDGISQ